MISFVIRRWCKENTGKILGFVLAANGVGSALATQIVSPMLYGSGDAFGYRNAYWMMAVVLVVVGVIVVPLMKEQPAEVAASSGKKAAKSRDWPGMDYSEVKKKPYFYIAAFLVFLTGISLQSIGSITIVYLSDLGFASGFLAATASVSSLVLTCSKLITGTTYDKWGLRTALLMCQFAALDMFVLKGLLTNTALGMVMAMTATVFSSIALPLETVIIPLMTNDLFGTASYTKVLGIFMAMNSLGLCLGSPIGELFRKIAGDYRPCFWFFTVVMVIVIVAFQFVLRAANKQKNAVLNA
jgi:MFS family permease